MKEEEEEEEVVVEEREDAKWRKWNDAQMESKNMRKTREQVHKTSSLIIHPHGISVIDEISPLSSIK